jgi:hypothetical protein
MRARGTIALVAAIAMPVLIVACGGSEGVELPSSGETSQVRAENSASRSAQAFSVALARSNRKGADGARGAAAACDLMTRQARGQLVASARIAAGPRSEVEDCEEALLYLATRSRSRESLVGAGAHVAHVRVRASLARVVLEDPDGRRSTLTLVEEGGRWKLAATE